MKFLLKQDNTRLKASLKSSLLGRDLCCRALGGKVQKGYHGASLLLIPTLASRWAGRAAQRAWMHCRAHWCWRSNVHPLDVKRGFNLWAAAVWHLVLKAPARHSQLTSTWENTQPLHSLGTGQVGQEEQGVPLEGVTVRGSESPVCPPPGAQSDRMGAPARPCPSRRSRWRSTKTLWPGKLRHEPGPKLFSHVLMRHFSQRQRDASVHQYSHQCVSGRCLLKHYSAA